MVSSVRSDLRATEVPTGAQPGVLAGPVAAIEESNENVGIWTHRLFRYVWDNPLWELFRRGNGYVANQWTAEYYVNVKATMDLVSTAAKAMLVSLSRFQLFTGIKHLVNLAIIGCKALTIEAGNITKGSLGIAISAVKSVQHALCFALYVLLGITALLIGYPEKAKKLLVESLNNLAFVGKDILTMFICLGQALPPWVPFAILLFCHPAGVVLLLATIAVKYTGLSDVLAYGGSAMLLFVQSKMALKTLRQRESQDQESLEKAEMVVRNWKKLKEELHPSQHTTAAVVAIFAARIFIEGIFTAMRLVIPGAAAILKYVAEGVEGATAAGIITARVVTYLQGSTPVVLNK